MTLIFAALSGCELIDDILDGAACSFYNAPIDEFRLSVVEHEVIVPVGSTKELTVSKTWLDSQLERVELSCRVDWVVEPQGLATVNEDDILEGVNPGSGTMTARVTGSGGVKQDSVRVAVVPIVNEVEPNNGPPAAMSLADGQTRYGLRDYAGDTDWFQASVPAGASVQFTLAPSIPLEGYWYGQFYGRVYASDGASYLGPANTTYTNQGAVPATVYLEVTASSANDPIPYAVRVDLFQ